MKARVKGGDPRYTCVDRGNSVRPATSPGLMLLSCPDPGTCIRGIPVSRPCPGLSWPGLVRHAPDRPVLDRTGPSWTGPARPGPDRTGLTRPGPDQSDGMVRRHGRMAWSGRMVRWPGWGREWVKA